MIASIFFMKLIKSLWSNNALPRLSNLELQLAKHASLAPKKSRRIRSDAVGQPPVRVNIREAFPVCFCAAGRARTSASSVEPLLPRRLRPNFLGPAKRRRNLGNI
jgi:hypothetical protein